jgi:hypothetical protein
MKATDIIRDVLDLIDKIECNSAEVEAPLQPSVLSFAELFAQLSQEKPEVAYDNSPDPHVQSISSVTTDAGGGWNGPKHPADMRSDSVSLYPNHTHKPE